MRILLFGSDSGAHALAWKLINSPAIERLMVAPGNAGSAFFATPIPRPDADPATLADLLFRESLDLVIADPAAGGAGITDEFRALATPVLGPDQAAWQRAMSRCATREWLQRHGLPLPRGRACATAADAEKYAATLAMPILIATDDPAGPAFVCWDRIALPATIAECFAASNNGVIVEEATRGPLVSAALLTDGRTAFAVPATRLHPVNDAPYAPAIGAHNATSPLWARLEHALQRQIRDPLLRAFNNDGSPVRAWIGATCVLADQGPLIRALHLAPSGLEAAVALLRLDSDLAPLLLACARGDLSSVPAPRWRPGAAIAVALQHRAGSLSHLANLYESLAPDVRVFHHERAPQDEPAAGIADGGRSDSTIAIVATCGADLPTARAQLYTNLHAARQHTFTFSTEVGAREL